MVDGRSWLPLLAFAVAQLEVRLYRVLQYSCYGIDKASVLNTNWSGKVKATSTASSSHVYVQYDKEPKTTKTLEDSSSQECPYDSVNLYGKLRTNRGTE